MWQTWRCVRDWVPINQSVGLTDKKSLYFSDSTTERRRTNPTRRSYKLSQYHGVNTILILFFSVCWTLRAVSRETNPINFCAPCKITTDRNADKCHPRFRISANQNCRGQLKLVLDTVRGTQHRVDSYYWIMWSMWSQFREPWCHPN